MPCIPNHEIVLSSNTHCRTLFMVLKASHAWYTNALTLLWFIRGDVDHDWPLWQAFHLHRLKQRVVAC